MIQSPNLIQRVKNLIKKNKCPVVSSDMSQPNPINASSASLNELVVKEYINLGNLHAAVFFGSAFSLSQLPSSVYYEAEMLAMKGKDPRILLDAVHTPEAVITTMEGKYRVLHTLKAHYMQSILEHLNVCLNHPVFSPEMLYNQIRPEEMEATREIISKGFYQFLTKSYNPIRENSILKLYDVNKNDIDIKAMLRKAKSKAHAGDIAKTQEKISQIQRKAAGDWSNECRNIIKAAHIIRFNVYLSKAEQHFAEENTASVENYLKKAEEHVKSIGEEAYVSLFNLMVLGGKLAFKTNQNNEAISFITRAKQYAQKANEFRQTENCLRIEKIVPTETLEKFQYYSGMQKLVSVLKSYAAKLESN